MLIVGLTGSIGMGKSTAAQQLKTHGIAVFDADAEVHKLYEGVAVAPIEEAFPGTTQGGEVDRAKLSVALLADPAGFKRLEAIVHPLVRAAQVAFLQDEARRGAQIAVLEIPLLFEGGGNARVDVVIVVSAPADVQRARVLERPGMTVEKLESLLSRQTSDEEKRRGADFVVDTGGTIADSQAEIDRIVAQLKGRAGPALMEHWS